MKNSRLTPQALALPRVGAIPLDEVLRMQERSRLWTSLLDQNTEGIVVCDSRVRIVIVNAAFERITGFSEMESIGRTPRILRSKRQDRAFYAQMWRVINASGHWNGEIWNQRKGGEAYPQWLSIKAVHDRPGHVTHYVGTYSDITHREAVEAQTKHLSEHDALTDLPNGLLLVKRLHELAAISRHAREKTGVLFVDLDRFNNINDSMGRRAGDQLLQTVSRRIASAVRHSDFVARLGADEFVVLLPELRQPSDASDVARAILDAISQPTTLAGQELVICASVGICISPDDGTQPDELIRNAGAAMYRAKREGRKSFQFYTREMNEGAAESLRTETALRLALEREELVLHYQPQVDLASGALVGVEALARWNRPGIGLLSPAQFIPIAEERGLMPQLGRYVLGKAIRQVKEWDVHGLAAITVAVNVSASEFHQAGFVDHLASEMQLHAIEPGRLELELTEGVALGNAAATIETLRQLHGLGVRLSLDDFGTGYSSLGYLGRLPIDRIKIDRSFISEMTAKPESIQIVRAIIALAKSFALKVIAEGVESAEQLATLRNEGCDEIQGYLAGVPVPPEEFAALLRAWNSDRFAAKVLAHIAAIPPPGRQ